MEREPATGDGRGEQFYGWGVVGLPFDSGHILALRRFPASSVGPPYTSVWHRAPGGRWTMYVDVPPRVSCPRYFGRAVDRVVETQIVIAWRGPRRFRVITGDAGFDWEVRVVSTPRTRLINAVAPRLPATWWKSRRVLGAMGRMAGPFLGAGTIRLHGRTPNAYRFRVYPHRLWTVADSSALVQGSDIGAPARLDRQARLGDFWIPQRGLLGFGETVFEPIPTGSGSARAA